MNEIQKVGIVGILRITSTCEGRVGLHVKWNLISPSSIAHPIKPSLGAEHVRRQSEPSPNQQGVGREPIGLLRLGRRKRTSRKVLKRSCTH